MAALTIDRVDAVPLRIPFDHWAPPPMFAGRPRTTIDMVLVRVETTSGLVGWGEAYGGGWPAVVPSLRAWVEPLAIGQDAGDPTLGARIERTVHNLGRAGPIIHAISGLDIALWDLRGKAEGLPVHALLGGKRRTRVEAYASLLQYTGSVDLVRTNVQRALDRGYRQIKLHERTPETVATAREVAGPDIPIMVDTNCAWLPEAATEAVRAMAGAKPLWVEEPIWPPEDFAALAKLQRDAGVPIAAGENASGALDFTKMVAAGAVDFAQPSVIKIGGLSALWAICNEVEAAGVTCVPHAPFFGPGYLATLHALAAKLRDSALERFFCDLAMMPYAESVPVTDGWASVPEAPGLGADPEPELIERFKIAT